MKTEVSNLLPTILLDNLIGISNIHFEFLGMHSW